MKTALLLVDVQRDFCPGGARAVEGGDQIIEPANRLIQLFEAAGWPLFFSRDWHPPTHCTFKQHGGVLPPHCIAETEGAAFHPKLRQPETATIISRAYRTNEQSHSAFEGTDLARQLDRLGIQKLIVAGLATDGCVKNSVLDARRRKLEVYVASDAVRAINLAPEDGPDAILLMQAAGAHFRRTAELIVQGRMEVKTAGHLAWN